LKVLFVFDSFVVQIFKCVHENEIGIRGTEVAKEAADIVLLDDEFGSIVAGMEQGRLCSENLRKSIMYTLCSKVPQVLPTFAELFGIPSALTAAQVLLIDIGTDIWTAMAFAWQPGESSLMTQAPRHPRKDRMVSKSLLVYAYGYMGILQAAACWAMLFILVPGFMSLHGKHPDEFTAEEWGINFSGMSVYDFSKRKHLFVFKKVSKSAEIRQFWFSGWSAE
jgi:magnesium-transporting ATPase (P-type)